MDFKIAIIGDKKLAKTRIHILGPIGKKLLQDDDLPVLAEEIDLIHGETTIIGSRGIEVVGTATRIR